MFIFNPAKIIARAFVRKYLRNRMLCDLPLSLGHIFNAQLGNITEKTCELLPKPCLARSKKGDNRKWFLKANLA